MYQWIQDNLLSPLYDPNTSDEVKQALSTLLTQDTRNQSYSQYKQAIQNALDVLPKNLREKVKVYFDIETESEDRQNKIQSWEKKLGIDNLEDELSKDQIDILLNPDFKFTGNALEDLKNALNEELGENPVDVSITLGDTMEGISSLTEAYELIQEVKEELKDTGNISAETLSSMQDKYEDLTEPISLFNAGLITSEELVLALSEAYEADKTNFENSINSKILALPEFYNSLGENQKQAIDDLAESYGVDLSNFKSVEGKKLNFQAEIIQKLANNYARYSGKSLEDLKLQRSKLGSFISSQKDFYLEYGHFSNLVIPSGLQVEYNALDNTITEIESFNNRLNDIIAGNLETYTFDPTKYIKPEKSKGSKSKEKDAWLEAYEKERAKIDHERQMDLISTAEYRDKLVALDNKYLAGREKYLDKHQKIQEEIYDLDKGFVQDELSVLSDLEGTEEEKIKAYNKLISIANTEIARALNEGIVDSSDYIKGLRKDVSDAGKAIEELNQKIFSRDMDDMSFSADMLSKRQGTEGKRISIYREMQNKILQEMDRAEANGIKSNKEYLQELEKQWWDLADNINSVLELSLIHI